ncbi:kinase domain-containing protein [Dendryphion nanum]|uniref:non-specific serine/threonine protein kinase n=1 Tax=Dendryphion nanum TaxID=256645 RepID=A0A9P9I9C5_9PLEO|nr:kinase domain-containing protein [Dendryphion nanum]
MEENRHHEHNVNNVKRQGKLSGIMLSKVNQSRNEEQRQSKTSNWIASMRKKKEEIVKKTGWTGSPQLIAQKYGRYGDVIGSGAFGTVRIAHRSDAEDEQLFAVKELKQRSGEYVNKYHTRVTGEFGISYLMHHPNVVTTLDMLQIEKDVCCLIMKYCAGGDLHAVILSAGQLEVAEADCFFKQLMWGVEYLHEMGIAHRDLKPENLLLTQSGTIKITDFGNAECFRTAWEMEVHMTTGVCGSAPYIAPEEYVDKKFDPRGVDVWACGVIYMAMRTGRHLWRSAQKDRDESFQRYLEDRRKETGYEPIEVLGRRACGNVIYSALDPTPTRRLTAHQILSSEWLKDIKVCSGGSEGI